MSISREFSIAPRYPRGGRPQKGPELPHEELQARIQVLKKEMQEHKGELVLMAVRHWERYGFDMPEERTPYDLDEDYYLGVIAPPYLKVKDYQIVVGTLEHVTFDVRRPHLGIKKEKGPINDRHAWETDLDRLSKSESSNNLLPQSKKLIEIIVGDQNVAGWVEKEATEGRMPSYVLNLKEEKPELFEREKGRYFDADLLNVFQRMYSVLGRKLVLQGEVAKRAD